MIAASATSVESMQKRETHTEQTRIYCECKNFKRALLSHIYTSIDEKYIEHLVDENTSLIEEYIPTVIEYLFANYGTVPSEEVK